MKALSNKKILNHRIPKLLGYGLTILVVLLSAALVYRLFFSFKPMALPKGSEIQGRIIVAPGVYHVGDNIPITLEVEARNGISFDMPDLSNIRLDPLEILSKSNLITEKPFGGIRQKIKYQLAAWDVGKHQLHGFNILYRSKTGIQKIYPVRTCFINIKSLLPASKSEQELAALQIKEAKKPVGMPPQYFILWWILGIIAGCGLVFMVVKYLQRFRSQKKALSESEVQNIPPKEAAHVIALRRLAALQKKDYLSEQAFKPYYTELAECIREYLENRFQIKALEMTTEEFLESLTMDQTLGKVHQQILTDFLQSADLVKFAKCLPLPAEAEKSLTLTKQLIEETKEIPIENEFSIESVNLASQEN